MHLREHYMAKGCIDPVLYVQWYNVDTSSQNMRDAQTENRRHLLHSLFVFELTLKIFKTWLEPAGDVLDIYLASNILTFNVLEADLVDAHFGQRLRLLLCLTVLLCNYVPQIVLQFA